MKVRFRSSGGFAGAIRGIDLDTSALDPTRAAELERLVKESGIPAGGAPAGDARDGGSASPEARDTMQYEISIEADGPPVSLLLEGKSVPTSVQPLLSYLKQRARPMPPS